MDNALWVVCVGLLGYTGGIGGQKIIFIMAKKKLAKKRNSSVGSRKSSNKKMVVVKEVQSMGRSYAQNRNTNRPGASAMALMNKGNVAAAFCLPHEAPPVRYSSVFMCAPTAVAAPYYLREANFSEGSTQATQNVPNGTHFSAVFRNPLRSLIQHETNPANLQFEYRAIFVTSTGGLLNVGTLRQGQTTDFDVVEPIWWEDVNNGDSSKAHPHGNILYSGSHEGVKGVWIDTNSTNTADVTLTLASGNGVIKHALLVGDSWVVKGEATTSASVAVVQPDESGYYAFWIKLSSAGTVDYSLTFKNAGDYISHLPMPNISDKKNSIEAIRTNAVAMMLSCEASQLNAAGKVAGYQVPAGSSWTTYALGTSPFDSVASSNGAQTLCLATGMYGFLKPTQPSDFDCETPFKLRNGAVVGADYEIIPKHDFLVIVAQTPMTAADTFPGGDCYLTATWGVEFRTSDVWYTTLPPRINPKVFERDLNALRGLQQFHENPFHFGDIMGFLKGAGKKVLEYSPSILSLLASLPTPYKPQLSAAAGLAEGARELFL